VDPQAEYERVVAKYPPSRWWELAAYVVVLGGLITWSLLDDRSWAFAAGGLLAVFGNEYRNYRLRENARRFAQGR
jgi:hypothetical protein